MTSTHFQGHILPYSSPWELLAALLYFESASWSKVGLRRPPTLPPTPCVPLSKSLSLSPICQMEYSCQLQGLFWWTNEVVALGADSSAFRTFASGCWTAGGLESALVRVFTWQKSASTTDKSFFSSSFPETLLTSPPLKWSHVYDPECVCVCMHVCVYVCIYISQALSIQQTPDSDIQLPTPASHGCLTGISA